MSSLAIEYLELNCYRLLNGEVVRIQVGDRGCKGGAFTVHSQLLAAKCPSAIEHGAIKDSSDGIIYMPHADTVIFELFLIWLYQGALKAEATGLRSFEVFGRLIALIVFADQRNITELVDQAMDYLIDHMSSDYWFSPFDMTETYDKLGDNCKLRLFIARSMVYHAFHQSEQGWASPEISEEVCKSEDLSCQVIAILLKDGVSGLGNPALAPRCEYHSHAPDEHCPFRSNSEPKTNGRDD